MTYPNFRPAAAADVEDAFLWYESQRSGLGDEYLDVRNITSADAEGKSQIVISTCCLD